MNSIKGKSAMVMTKGIMDVRTDPPSLVCTILKFRHEESGKEVTLLPVPNIASPDYFKRILTAESLLPRYDRVLVEDGRLPFVTGSAMDHKQRLFRRIFPYFSFRPVVPETETRFDGAELRDPIESRMSYQMVLDGCDPPIDPRARRGVERIMEHYEPNLKVAVPWGVYHMPYFRYRLLKEGFTQVEAEEVVVFGFRQILGLLTIGMAASLVTMLLFASIFFF